MFTAATWRIAWKEYRTQRPLWLAMAVLTLLIQFGYQLAVTVGGGDVSETALFAMTMGAAAVYALGCGATLFATERETGTFEFQRGLPLAWRPLFVGKAGFGAASVLALAILLWSVTIVMAGGRLPAWRDSGQLWGGGLLAAWEVFAWSLFFSLRMDRPLVAAVLGVLVPSVFVHVAAPAVVGFDYHSVGLRHYLAIVPWRVGIAVAVSAADVWLASRWLRESGPTGDAGAGSVEGTELADRGRILLALEARLQGGFWRLVWQHWLHSRWTMLAIGFGYLCVAVLATQAARPEEWNVVPLGWLVPAAAIWGVTVFLADQRRHGYRFFVERGVDPRQVWLSRQVVGLAPLVLGLAAALIFWALCPQLESGRTLRWPPTDLDARYAGGAVCCVLLAYAAGQACSMFFRSPILALVGTAFSAGVLVFWVTLMHAAGISWWWSVLPIPAVLLVATWRRTPDWMLERSDWAARRRLASVLALPAATLATAVILVRINEIPQVEPGFDVAEYLRPLSAEQQETLQLYGQAAREFSGWKRIAEPASEAPDNRATSSEPTLQEQRRWEADNQTTIALLLQASRRPPCGLWDPAHGQKRLAGPFSALDGLLMSSAAVRMADGQLDQAWERYRAALRIANEHRIRSSEFAYGQGDAIEAEVYERLPQWAAHPQQTPKRIQAALRELERLSRDVPSATSIIKDAYVEAVQPLDGDFRRIETDDPKSVRMLRLTYALLPWETARARRLACFGAARHLARIQSLEQSMNQPGATIRQRFFWQNTLDPRWHELLQFDTWMGTTPLASRGFWFLRHTFRLDDHVLEHEMYRRVVRVQLALLAWRMEHGQFPRRLDNLVGPYFGQLPLDPSCGRLFRYEPQGWQRDTRWVPTREFYQYGVPLRLDELLVVIPARCPFLWTPDYVDAPAASQPDEPPKMLMPDGSQVPSGYLFVVDPQQPFLATKATTVNE
jgi:hypothetical protein